MTTSTIPDPSTRYRRTGQRGLNGQMMSWLFMRMSGVLLVILVFGHLFVNLWLGEGVQGIDFAFVAGKWTSPFWQVWDLTMLWLGLLHGGNEIGRASWREGGGLRELAGSLLDDA